MDRTAGDSVFPGRWRDAFVPRDGAWYRWRFAGAEIFLRRLGSLWTGFCRPRNWKNRRPGESSRALEIPETPAGAVQAAVRYAGSGGVKAALFPCLPEKPLMINLGRTFRIFPGMEMIHTVEIPPVLRLYALETDDAPPEEAAPKQNLLENRESPAGASVNAFNPGEAVFTFHPFILNETWYGGDTMRGMICLSLSAAPDPGDSENPEAAEGPGTEEDDTILHCDILIRNRAKTVMEVEKFPLYGAGLSLYEKDGQFLTGTPVIDFCGNGNFSMGCRAPEGALLLAEGLKESVGELLIQQGSRIIKNITGM
ncbi:MAG: hypothetical protein LBD31_02015 [Treponema sp.]|jgi:hypothetical protein|nr:hypothetical protein [Treponema sp.]